MILAWTVFFSSLGLLWHRAPDHFDQTNLYQECSHALPASLPSSISQALQQPFTYLGEGAQVYAFASSDGTLVLKLFKARHQKSFKLSRFLEHLMRSDAEWELSRSRWKGKFQETAHRYELAFAHLREETGLVYLHFAPTKTPLPVTVIDKYTYDLDLASVPFVLQKRAELAPDYFKRLQREGNEQKIEAGKKALKQFFVLRAKKGFSDPRQTLSINYGFINDRPIQLDVGKIEPVSGNIHAEMAKIHAHIDTWVSDLLQDSSL